MTKAGWLRRLWCRLPIREFLLYGLIFIVAGFLGNLWMTRDQASGLAPVTSAVNLQGQTVALVGSSSEQPLTLLYFFAEWCPICKLQNGAIDTLSGSVPVVGIAMQSGSDEQVRAYAAGHDLRFPIVNDQTGYISRNFGVVGVPATFLIDSQGNILDSTRGYATTIGLYSRLWLSHFQLGNF